MTRLIFSFLRPGSLITLLITLLLLLTLASWALHLLVFPLVKVLLALMLVLWAAGKVRRMLGYSRRRDDRQARLRRRHS